MKKMQKQQTQSEKMEKISYDKESRVLSFKMKRGKSADSDVQDSVVLDYDKKGDLVRIDFYDIDFGAFREEMQSVKSFANHLGVPMMVK